MPAKEQPAKLDSAHANPKHPADFKDMEVRHDADAIKGGRPVRKGGDPEDGGE